MKAKIQGECVQRMDVRDNDYYTLYDRFAYPIFRYICRHIPNKQDAEDLMVEVFLAACNNEELETFSVQRQFAWLLRVTKNKVIDRHRHLALLTMVPIELAHELEDDTQTPEQYAEKQESYERLYRALETLAPLQRELIQLRYTNNMSNGEIARILGKSEEAVRQLYSRTIRQLRGVYQQIEGGKQP
jgi:RNA polymerase sigma factor (sigma-70 family)